MYNCDKTTDKSGDVFLLQLQVYNNINRCLKSGFEKIQELSLIEKNLKRRNK